MYIKLNQEFLKRKFKLNAFYLETRQVFIKHYWNTLQVLLKYTPRKPTDVTSKWQLKSSFFLKKGGKPNTC